MNMSMGSNAPTVMVPEELNYKQKQALSEPQYDLLQIIADDGDSSKTLSATSSLEQVFTISGNSVFNFAKSRLRFDVLVPEYTIDGPVHHRTVLHQYGLSEIQSISVTTRRGTFLLNIPDLPRHTRATLMLQTPKYTQLQKPLGVVETGAAVTWAAGNAEPIQRTGTLSTSTVAAYRAPTAAAVGRTLSADGEHGLDYHAVKWFHAGVAANGAEAGRLVYRRDFPLSVIKDCLFQYDKDLFFGEEIQIHVHWSSLPNLGFQHSGAAGAWTTTPVNVQAATLNNISLMIAEERNNDLAEAMRLRVQNVGFKVVMPYPVQTTIPASAGTTKYVIFRVNSSYGRSLLRTYVQAHDTNDVRELRWNAVNTDDAKTLTYHTGIDGQRLQSRDLDTSELEDFQSMSDVMKDSSYSCALEWLLNPVHVDIFGGPRQAIQWSKSDFEAHRGLDLSTERTYFVRATTANAALIYLVECICQRELIISPMGVSMQ